MNKVRVLIVDDHVIVRDGVRMILEAQPDIEVVGEASDGREALERARSCCRASFLWTSPCPE
jgi:DNA-binding NarL/FixJ family response regulator